MARVAQHITGYEPVKLKPEMILEERGETLPADATLVERFIAHGRTWSFARADGSPVAFHTGEVLSGAKLVNNREFPRLAASPLPDGVGRRDRGDRGVRGGVRKRVPVLLVKAICDWADGTKNDRAQPFAASLVRHVLDRPDVLASLGVPLLG